MDQVEEIKQKVDIVELISEYLPLKRAGRNYKGLCPWHGEKTPSFMVNPELQIYKCFGCQEGGDAYSFLQKMEGVEFGEALQILAKRVGVTLTGYKPTQGEEVKEKLVKMNTVVADAYHWLLTKHKSGRTALEYLQGRGLSEEIIEKFKLGYAPDSWEFLSDFLVKKKGYKMDDLRRGGLVVEGRNYDRFRKRIVFPLANHRGQIMGFAGRILPGADERAGGKYVNTPETEIYHKSELLYGMEATRAEIKKEGWAVVVEGEIDMIASFQAGVKNVVAIKGSALTERQVELLRRVCDTIVLALDADVAGDAAARRGIEIADKNGLMVKMVKLTGAKDPGELAIGNPEGWKKAVAEAIPIYDFYLQSAVERFGLDVAGKKKIGQELLPIWEGISDEIVKALYIKKLAEVLGVGEEDVRAQLVKVSGSKTKTAGKTQVQDTSDLKKTGREVREEYVVGLVVNSGKWEKLAEVRPLIKTDFWRRVVEGLEKERSVKKLPAELRGRVETLVFFDTEWSEKEWGKAMGELEEMTVREDIQSGEGKVESLTKRLSELTKGK